MGQSLTLDKETNFNQVVPAGNPLNSLLGVATNMKLTDEETERIRLEEQYRNEVRQLLSPDKNPTSYGRS